ncbi:MAG: immune inhibitor A, partial [Candidatus Krumholzibacteria bacterium]|nr:immune inhibitor A [Candidatus Krumholzibacteria bacterium]
MKKALLAAMVVLIISPVFVVEAYAELGKTSALVRTRLTRDLTKQDLIERGIDILAVYPDGRVDLAVTDEQLCWIRSRTSLVAVLERAELAAPSDLDVNLGLYHTYDEMEVMLDSLAAAYPSLTSIDTLGASIEGRLIRAIKISDNADIDEGEPEVFIIGCHHARELMSVEVPLLLAEYLLANYGMSPEVTQLVDSREIWIAPMINPDGHVYVQNNHGGPWWTWWRKNRRDNGDGSFGVDPNRNYSYMWGYDNEGSSPSPSSEVYRGTAPFSEPETQAVRDFCASRSFIVALSYHSYSELILFPWGYSPIYTNDHELFVALADSLKRGNDYTPGCTAMGTIYATNGDTDDWAYGDTSTKNRFYCLTIELNSYEEGGFAPPESLIQPTFQMVLPLNLTLIRRADNPFSVLGPQAPCLYDVTMLNPPNYELGWSGGSPTDPNPPVSWKVVEFKNLCGVADPCELGDTLWTLDGFTLTSLRSYNGAYSFYSGMGDNLGNSMSMASIYPLSFSDTLSCWLWYDIENGYDYAYLEASLDQGLTWETVPGNRTTNDDPYGSNRGNGITGSSGGWVSAEFYLDEIGVIWEDVILLIRFSYITDSYVTNEGLYVDMVDPVAAYERRIVLTEAYPDTFFHRWPEETGEYAYFVRAIDSEDHKSRRSNVVFHTVDDLTPAMPPTLGTALSQNYPNPFNPVTTIRFTVGEVDLGRSGTAHVFLGLYDVS